MTKLFGGAVYDSYKIYNIYVQVYDDDGSYTTYQIAESIIVLPDLANLLSIMNSLITANPYFSTNVILNQGSYLSSLQEIQRISSLLNEQSLSDKLALNLLNESSKVFFQDTYGPLSTYFGVIPVRLKFIYTPKKTFFSNFFFTTKKSKLTPKR